MVVVVGRGWWRVGRNYRRAFEPGELGGNKSVQREEQARICVVVILNCDDLPRVQLNCDLCVACLGGGGDRADGEADESTDGCLHCLEKSYLKSQ